MLEKLIEHMRTGQAEAIRQAETTADGALQSEGLIYLPSDFSTHDVESFMPNRRRMRGDMSTSVVNHFASYAKAMAQDGATVFIDPVAMRAKAVLDLGTPDRPGHCGHTATLIAKQTAAYAALRQAASGRPMSQQMVAEFFEDWMPYLKFTKDDAPVEGKHAVAAVRKITIEALRKVESEEQSLSASRSTFEAVSAQSNDPIPTRITFRCMPYAGFSERAFDMRLGVLTSGNAPAVVLRLVNIEAAEEAMAEELAYLVRGAFDSDWDERVLLGTHTSK